MDAGTVTVLHNARLGLDPEPTTLVFGAAGVSAAAVEPAGGAGQVVELDGRTVLPGLWDHHVHADQLALVEHALDLSGAGSVEEVAHRIREQLAAGTVEPELPLLGYGFRDALWPRPAHRRDLDAVSGSRPLVMVSADLHQGWLNAAALRRFGLLDDGTGLLREHAWFDVLEQARTVPPEVLDRWALETAARAVSRGVVGVVDFENTDPLAPWPRRHQLSALPWRVRVGVWPQRLDRVLAEGLRTGDELGRTDGLVTLGSLKVISDGSLNTRTAYCYDAFPGSPPTYGQLNVAPERLVPLMARAHQHGLQCAIHAIGDRANSYALDAFARVGAVGTIEHAQLLADDDVPRFAALGVTASVQPEHAHDDRDVADRLWAGRTGRSFPYGALHRAGARLLLGSDAPVAPLDPLLTVAAAISRSRDGRQPWHPEHELPLSVALAASTGTGRVDPRPGDPADLTILDLEGLGAVTAAQLRSAEVAGTLVGGRWTHRSGI